MPVDFRAMDKALIKAFGVGSTLTLWRSATGGEFEFTPIREELPRLEGVQPSQVSLPLFCDPDDFGSTPPVAGDKVIAGSATYSIVTVDYDEAGALMLGLRKVK